MRYTINLVTYNSGAFLDEALRCIWKLTTAPEAVIIIDNASSDETRAIITAHQQEHPHQLLFLRNTTNIGFSKAHNQAIALAERKGVEAVLLLNHDVYLEQDYSTTLLQHLVENPQAGCVVGKLLRVDPTGQRQGRPLFDSAGLVIDRSLRIRDRAAGEEDRGQHDQQEERFGATAAATLYRLSALQDIQMNNTVFDEHFTMYKEDVDVAWRLQWRGWKTWYVPEATAHHYRTHRGGAFKEMLRQRHERTLITRQLSYRNHWWMLLRNCPSSAFLRFAPWIIPYETVKFFYCALLEPRTLAVTPEVVRTLPQRLQERRSILHRKLSDTSTVLQWIGRA